MPTALRTLLGLAALVSAAATAAHGALSIPSPTDVARAASVAAGALRIANVPRTFTVGNTTYPYIHGPELAKPSLYYATLVQQLLVLNTTENPRVDAVRATLAARGPYTTAEAFRQGYEALEAAGLMAKPQALDNSDESFGAARLGLRGHNLALVRGREYDLHLDEVPASLVEELCGAPSMEDARAQHRVFAQDFAGYRDFSDERASAKYAPNVLGFFCRAGTSQLRPLAITLLDTGLTYTKRDSAGEWQLAKMALDATELNYVQMRHLVETHLVSIPIQVEMMRSMDQAHPLYALLDYHLFADLALESRGGAILFQEGSPYDRSMAFGAGGSMRFIVAEFARHTLQDDLPSIIQVRGLHHLPDHRYVRYGEAYYSAVKAFVTAYVKTYYPSEDLVAGDVELQTWAARASAVPEVYGFPAAFSGYDDLVALVTHLVFQNAVKHHFMNGIVTWHSQAAPFSAPALYGSTPLPTAKGADVDPLDYAIPSDVFPLLSYMAARFHRPIPRKFSALEAYADAPFADEPALKQHIEHFHQLMQLLELYVDNMESKEAYPYSFVKPSLLPWFSYI